LDIIDAAMTSTSSSRAEIASEEAGALPLALQFAQALFCGGEFRLQVHPQLFEPVAVSAGRPYALAARQHHQRQHRQWGLGPEFLLAVDKPEQLVGQRAARAPVLILEKGQIARGRRQRRMQGRQLAEAHAVSNVV
jgi:hypothetical protein